MMNEKSPNDAPQGERWDSRSGTPSAKQHAAKQQQVLADKNNNLRHEE